MRYLEINCPSECPFNNKIVGKEYLTACLKLNRIMTCNDKSGFNKDCPLKIAHPYRYVSTLTIPGNDYSYCGVNVDE